MSRTVIITGGTKGLGREISVSFATAGYFVIALYAGDEGAARELEGIFAAGGMRGVAIRHDISEENGGTWSHPEIESAEDLTMVHCACAPFIPTPMHQLQWKEFERQMAVGVRGAWLASQALVRPMLKKKRCTWVNILTSALENPPRGFCAYATAKHALRGFTLAMGAEYGPRGMRVFSVSPGFMDTPLTAAWDSRLREAMASGGSVTDPKVAALRILELAGSAEIAGRGEDYPV